MGIEGLDQLGKVGERAGEAIDLVDDDAALVAAGPDGCSRIGSQSD
jgi:hypothetical protein